MTPIAATVTAVLAVAAGALLAGCGTKSGTAAGSDAGAGKVSVIAAGDRAPAPDMTGELLDGGTYRLVEHRGEVVVVNFWASWCAPCRAEAADLEAVHKDLAGRGVSFVGIDIRDERDKARAFVAGRTTYPNVFDPAGRLALGFKIPPSTTPATLVIGRDGKVAAIYRRPVQRAELRSMVERIAAEHG